jgi:hypothetical protein
MKETSPVLRGTKGGTCCVRKSVNKPCDEGDMSVSPNTKQQENVQESGVQNARVVVVEKEKDECNGVNESGYPHATDVQHDAVEGGRIVCTWRRRQRQTMFFMLIDIDVKNKKESTTRQCRKKNQTANW